MSHNIRISEHPQTPFIAYIHLKSIYHEQFKTESNHKLLLLPERV